MSMSALVKFGVLTDIQYADSDDKTAEYDSSKTRFYRNSLNQIDKAFDYWINKDINFVIQLGDIIDGINTGSETITSVEAIQRVTDRFECNPYITTYHTVGNHELYNFRREEMPHLLKQIHVNTGFNGLKVKNTESNDIHLYYKFNPCPGVKFISLDCYEISVLGLDPKHSNYIKAAEILHAHHGHYDWDGWDSDHNLLGPNKRFQSMNGAVSDGQLEWLENELQESDSNNEMVIVFGHIGVHPDSCGWDLILWNYDEVIKCFNRHNCVAAYLNGHAHNYGYSTDNGIHYVVFQAIIETPPESESFATISVFKDRIEIEGNGVEHSRTLIIENNNYFNDKEVIELIDGPNQEINTNPTVKVASL